MIALRSGLSDVALGKTSTRRHGLPRLERPAAPGDDPGMRASASRKPAQCPIAPPHRQTTYARAMHSACLILGGVPQLAEHLGVPAALVRDWLEGDVEPPHAMFLAAVEVIILHLETPGRAT